MKRTKHFQARMSQRSIPGDILDLALELGEPVGSDRIVLSRKKLQDVMSELRIELQRCQKALEKGGVVVVAEGDIGITTYRLTNKIRKPRTRKNGKRELEWN